jgi:hypothetical protein
MIHLWARVDGGEPKCVAKGAKPRGPGKVYRVDVRSVAEARQLLVRWLEVRGEDPARLAVRAEYEPGLTKVAEVIDG